MDAFRPERRTVERLSGHTLKSVRLRSDAVVEVVGGVQNISVLGIGIRTTAYLEPGATFLLEPGESGRSLSPQLTLEVRHIRKVVDDYLIGCRFGRVLSTDDVMQLGH